MLGRFVTSVAAALVVAVLGAPAAASAACGAVKRAKPRPAAAPPLAVGDSVMLGAFDELVARTRRSSVLPAGAGAAG